MADERNAAASRAAAAAGQRGTFMGGEAPSRRRRFGSDGARPLGGNQQAIRGN